MMKKDGKKFKEVSDAIFSHDYETFLEIISANPSLVDGTDCSGLSLLEFSIQVANLQIAKVLLNMSSNVNRRDQLGNTPLIQAALFGCTGLIDLLLSHGAMKDLENYSGETAISSAVAKGYSEIVNILIENGVDVNKKDQHGASVLAWAIPLGNFQIVQDLINAGADVNASDDDGFSIVQCAVQGGNLEILQLVASHPNFQKVDKKTYVRLLSLEKRNHEKAKKILSISVKEPTKNSNPIF